MESDAFPRRGLVVRFLGAALAIIGMLIVLTNWHTPGYQDEFFVGALLVVAGLLLRIEGAITGRR